VPLRAGRPSASSEGRIGMTEHDDDTDEITITEEDLERAMRVYTPEEARDFQRAVEGLPSRRQPTVVWQEFLARMMVAPQTPATQAAIRVAQRELLWRREGSA
jgi:hypothetical protein